MQKFLKENSNWTIIHAQNQRFLAPHAVTEDLLVATLAGTFISAIGMAIVFSLNASTGGTDIIAKIMKILFNRCLN